MPVSLARDEWCQRGTPQHDRLSGRTAEGVQRAAAAAATALARGRLDAVMPGSARLC